MRPAVQTIMLLVVSLLGVPLGACTNTGVISEIPLQGQDAPYLLDSGDRLRVIVFGQTDLSGEYSVDGAGQISIPLMSPIPARGLTPDELEASLVANLAQTLLRDPSVSVEVLSFRPFFILGEVTNAGQYPFVAGMSVKTAVAIAGGYTHRANERVAVITRNLGDRIVEIGVETSEAVRPGDTVLIKERYF
ncbi:MAG: polysaccharide biosynthesis/export family protein [Parvibaculum sp.]